MPGFDGTGPRGMGSMTGGGRGPCNPYRMRIAWNPFGTHHWPGPGYQMSTATPYEQEIDFLKREASELKKTLEDLNEKIRELSKDRT